MIAAHTTDVQRSAKLPTSRRGHAMRGVGRDVVFLILARQLAGTVAAGLSHVRGS